MAAQPTTKRGFQVATAADVRAFAKAKGLPAGGSRGRLPLATIEAFNKAHSKGKGRAFYGRTPIGEATYVLRGPKGGVQKSWTGPSHLIREWNAIQGRVLPARGRLPQEAIEAFLTEGV